MTRARDESRRSLWVPHRRINMDVASSTVEFTGLPTTAKFIRIQGFLRPGTTDAYSCLRVGTPSGFEGGAGYWNGNIYGNGAAVTTGSANSNTQFIIGLGGRNDMPQNLDVLITRAGGGTLYTMVRSIIGTWANASQRMEQAIRTGMIGTALNFDRLQFFMSAGNIAQAHLNVEYSNEVQE
jgi:hypothetical protein